MSKVAVSEVYWITEGSPLLTAMSDVSPANGGRIAVEAHTDFPAPTDGETRTIKVDDEEITYTDVDKTTDELVDITRAVNGTVAAAHAAGTFVQYGTEPNREKLADGFIDDDDALSEGLEINRLLWRYYPKGERDHEDMEVASVRYLADGHPLIIDAPDNEDKAVEPVFVEWSMTGPIEVGVRPHQLPLPFSGTIEEVRMAMGEGGEPTGDSAIADVLLDGVSILTTKIEVAAGATLSDAIEPTTKQVTKGQLLQVEFEQVGSTLPGSDPTVYATLFPSENAIAGRIEVAGEQGDPGADGLITEVQDEGTPLTDAAELNFTGDGVTATSDGTTITVDIPGGSGSGGILGYCNYNPSTTSTSHANDALQDIDATNIKVTFTVPASGIVKLTLSANSYNSLTGEQVVWAMRNSGTLVTGSEVSAIGASAWASGLTRVAIISGLTPDDVLTWTWAHRRRAGSGSTVTTRYGGDWGPATIVIEEVPA